MPGDLEKKVQQQIATSQLAEVAAELCKRWPWLWDHSAQLREDEYMEPQLLNFLICKGPTLKRAVDAFKPPRDVSYKLQTKFEMGD